MDGLDLSKELNAPKAKLTWQKSLEDALRTKDDFEKFFGVKLDSVSYPAFLPINFANKLKRYSLDSPLMRQFIPSKLEDDETMQADGMDDPIGDCPHNASNQIIHRYKNRALLMITQNCAGACRFCFRKHNLKNAKELFEANLNNTISYLKNHTEIEEIILSGGDPLVATDDEIFKYLEAIEKETVVKFLRIHTRTPVYLPERFDKGLLDMLKVARRMFLKVIVVVHINHPDEIDNDVVAVVQKLKDLDIEVMSQSALLNGVNDDPMVLKDLINKLVLAGIRPYYLHHPDRAKGAMHFYVDMERGRKIYSKLRDMISGWALPQYILDIPGGYGKTNAYNPEGFEPSGKYITKNGKIIKIKELTAPLKID